MTTTEMEEKRHIRLKSADGVPVDYSDVRYIDIPTPSGNVANFMNTAVGGCYYATCKNNGGVYYYTIKGQFFASCTSRSIFGTVTDTACKELGELNGESYQLYFIFTHKSLTIGNTYNEYEI